MSVLAKFRTHELHPHHLGKFTVLLVVLIAIIILFPFVDEHHWIEVAVGAVGFLTVLAALWAVSNSIIVFIVAALLAMPAFALNILNSVSDGDHFAYYAVPMSFAFYALVNLNLLRSFIGAKEVTWDIISGAVSVYLLLGMNWTLIYIYIDMFNPDAFQFNHAHDIDGGMNTQDFFYFSFVTLTTLGYGDVVPLSTAARIFAVLEAILGQLYIAVIIGKIISVAKLRGDVVVEENVTKIIEAQQATGKDTT